MFAAEQTLRIGIEAAYPPFASKTDKGEIVGFDYDIGKQFTQIDNFIAAGVDLILLNPADSKAIGPAIKKAQAAGIVVVAVDTFAEGADAVVTTDRAVAAALERSGIEPWTPDAFVTFIVDTDPARARTTLLRMVRRRWLPGTDETDDALLSRLVTWARRALGDSCADLLACAR